jgi:NADH-quinone oxidoreductase subunit L
MTAYYSFRLYFRVFEGPLVVPTPPPPDAPDVDKHVAADLVHHGTAVHDHGHAPAGHGHGHGDDHDHHHDHEPFIMIAPLAILALGAILAGVLAYHHAIGNFLGESPSYAQTYHMAVRTQGTPEHIVHPLQFGQHHEHEILAKANPEFAEKEHHVHVVLMIVSALIAGCGVYMSYLIHLRDRAAADRLAERFAPIVRVLDNKFYIDEIYQAGIVEPLRALGRVFFTMDRFVVDGLVTAASFVPQAFGWLLRFTTQRGYLQGYAVTMLFGIVAILVFVFW